MDVVPNLSFELRFGMYKGQYLQFVPDSYLKWWANDTNKCNKSRWRKRMRGLCRKELKLRAMAGVRR